MVYGWEVERDCDQRSYFHLQKSKKIKSKHHLVWPTQVQPGLTLVIKASNSRDGVRHTVKDF